MTSPLPLRARFTWLAVLLGFVLSALAAFVVLALAEDYEYIVANEILRGQAEDYGLRLANGLPAALPQTNRLRGYTSDAPDLPPAYAALAPGVHEDPGNDDIHIGVFDTAAGRLVFVIDLGDIEVMERHLHLLVALMLVLGTALFGILAWLIAGIALRPLRELAVQVEALPVLAQATRLADGFGHDELGRLAAAIDAYQTRLVDADAREQAFLADASHELRTPLAVIGGAVEVLADDAAAVPRQHAPLQRLERGVAQMQRLLEAMLAAARRRPLQAETVAAADVLREAVECAFADGEVARVRIEANGTLRVARREAVLLLAGLLRRLHAARPEAALRLRREPARIILEAAIEPAPLHEHASARADVGTGSALLDRLATRLGWQLALSTPTQVVLGLDPAAAAPTTA
ncbi:MAG: HAMP domain-containing histidine kinase [Dokdonella sp.]|uniref:sensor histidine kinase n=1 Tax=Dokdonella sp. TaxID=2291710 RepID=UPI0025BBBF5E|nr:HAMP domain-containing sensor histidine kinase [Dokdonella sp.]MBX3700382.1 HAMP domain-containing histidine kinase [Dokdonella sp.]MCW5577741.1 HAMP domain-containing histidine kinase [Dokdonella sp.]